MYIQKFSCGDLVLAKNYLEFNKQADIPVKYGDIGRIIFPGSEFDIEVIVSFNEIEYSCFQTELELYLCANHCGSKPAKFSDFCSDECADAFADAIMNNPAF